MTARPQAADQRLDPTGIPIFKVSGCGNDFIALREAGFLTPERIDILCARGHSLGADGVFAISRLEEHPARVRMVHFNADGTPAKLCVNGTRCAGMLAFHLGWADERVTIETGAGDVEAVRIGPEEIRLTLAPPSRRAREVTVSVGGHELTGWYVDTGVPHYVLEWAENMVLAPVAELGPEIRSDPAFEEGTNVDFVRLVGRHRLELRTYERGVECETLACGTGVLAAAAVAVQLGRAELPLTVLTSGGFELEVDGSTRPSGSISSWTLAGDARLIAEGTLSAGALSIPGPPPWTP